MQAGRIAALTCLLVIATGRAAADDPEPRRFEAEQPHMGTVFRIVLYAPDAAAAEAATKAAFARVKALEAVMSDYSSASEVSKLCAANDADPGKPRPASDDLVAVLGVALDLSRKTDGAFDVTVGPLSKLWRETRKTKALPTPEVLTAAREKVGYPKVEMDARRKTVRLAVAGMRLDFGGIGKGFAADAALAVLRQHGVTRALVAASGDITAGDPPPGRDGWTVDIPPIGKGLPTRRVKLANASVSTSGDLFQYVEIGRVRYSHVLDPRTGLGLTGRRSATVIAPKGVLADGLTKAASLLPPATLESLLDGIEGAAAFVVVKAAEDAEPVTTRTKRFAAFEVSPDPGGKR
jgi:thiamine biosynthesis lipoprotein